MMMFKLLRMQQWYKNIVVFLAIVFSGNLFNIPMLGKSMLGFIALCLISSCNYIINDIKDIEKDRMHAEKRMRPIASGKLSIQNALVVAMLLFFVSMGIAYWLSNWFFVSVAALFLMNTFYTFITKSIAFVDVLSIAFNFVIRALAGALLIGVWISPFLILVPFFLACFLASGKRYSDKLFIKETVSSRIQTYIFFYSSLISYAVYCWFVHPLLFITLPLAFYSMMRYLRMIFSGAAVSRRTELVFKDLILVSSLILFAVLTIFIVYFKIFFL